MKSFKFRRKSGYFSFDGIANIKSDVNDSTMLALKGYRDYYYNSKCIDALMAVNNRDFEQAYAYTQRAEGVIEFIASIEKYKDVSLEKIIKKREQQKAEKLKKAEAEKDRIDQTEKLFNQMKV